MEVYQHIERHLLKNRVVALHIAEEDQGHWSYFAQHLNTNKAGEITILGESNFDSTGTLEQWLVAHENSQVLVTVDASEILVRQVESETGDRDELLRKLIPQGDPNDFFVQALPNGEKYWVAVVRKHVIENVLALLPANVVVANMVLAPITLAAFALATGSTPLAVGRFAVENAEGTIKNILPSDGEVELPEKLRNDQVSPDNALAFAVAITCWSSIHIISDYEGKRRKEELMHKVFFRQYAKFVVGAIFAIFFVNAFVFLNLSDVNQRLSEDDLGVRAMTRKVEEYQKFIDEHDYRLGNSNQFTRIADFIGSTVPPEINLTLMEVKPLYLQSKEEKIGDRIIISGVTTKPEAYTSWIQRLANTNWIVAIERNEYHVNSQSGVGTFRLEVKFNEDV